MANQDTRVGERQATSMRIKVKYPDVDTFIQKYAVNISRGGIFIATKSPKPIGTPLRFEFVLGNAEGTAVIRGEGTVQWIREFDPAAPNRAHGMGIRFTRLDPDSLPVVERALAFRAQAQKEKEDAESRAESAPSEEQTKPGMLPEAESGQPPAAAAPPPPPPSAATAPPTLGKPLPTPAVSPQPAVRLPDIGGLPRPLPLDDERLQKAIRRQRREQGSAPVDLDALAREWGLSEVQLARALRHKLARSMDLDAELDRLLAPAGPAEVSIAEASRLLEALLTRHVEDKPLRAQE